MIDRIQGINKARMMTKIALFLLFSVIGWFVFSFIIMPVFAVLKEVFFADGQFSFESIKKLIEFLAWQSLFQIHMS